MARRRVTLAEVAQRAGVSRTTASFVLSGRSDMRISAEASRRVVEAAEYLGYRPNLTARSLRTNVTQTIALVSDSIATTQYAGELIRGCVEAALAQDRLLFITETEGDTEGEERLVGGLLDRQVDGVIYASMYTREVRPPAALRNIPLVLLNCLAEGFGAPAVIPDEVGAGRTAARTLLAAGHRAGIHVIGGHHITEETPDGVFAGRERMRGVGQALRRGKARPAGVVECGWSLPEHAFREVGAMLAAGVRPAALICCNDRLAFGAYQAISAAGLRIPGDVSVISFDDSELASWLRPQLSSIALPHYELGRRAVELLISELLDPVVHRVRMPLCARESVAIVASEGSDSAP